jgi:hypothetical protein
LRQLTTARRMARFWVGPALGRKFVGADQADLCIAERRAHAMQIWPRRVDAGHHSGFDWLGDRVGLDRRAGRHRKGHQGGNRRGCHDGREHFENATAA